MMKILLCYFCSAKVLPDLGKSKPEQQKQKKVCLLRIFKKKATQIKLKNHLKSLLKSVYFTD